MTSSYQKYANWRIVIPFLLLALSSILLGGSIALLDQPASMLVAGLPFLIALIATTMWLLAKRGGGELAILASLIGLWVAAQIWQAALPQGSPIGTMALQLKNLLGISVLLVWVGLLIVQSGSIRMLRIEVDSVFRAGVLFVALVALTLFFNASDNWQLVLMYAGWTVYAYLLIPNLLNSKRRFVFAIRVVTVITLAVLMWYIYSGVSKGVLSAWNQKDLTFEFNAVQIYGRALVVAFLGCLILFVVARRGSRRIVIFAVLLSLLYLMWESDSRSNTLFAVVVIATFGFYSGRLTVRVLAFAFGTVVFLALMYALLTTDVGDLNEVSSGRLLIYERSIAANIETGSAIEMLFGTRFETGRLNSLASETARPFERRQIESNYFTLLFSHGLVGLLLFTIPIVVVFVRLHKSIRYLEGEDKWLAVTSIGSVLGLAVSSLTINHLPSFGNPLAIFLPLIWLPVVGFVNSEPASVAETDEYQVEHQ